MIEAFLSDIHLPYHEPATWKLTFRLLKKINPQLVYLCGDIVDFHPVSKYPKDPATAQTLQDELDVAFTELSKLRQLLPSAHFYYRKGNHEARLEKYLFSKAAELCPLRNLQLSNLLRLDELDIEYIDDTETHKVGSLYHIHGHEIRYGGSVYPARGLYLKLGVPVIFGHFHKFSQYLDRALDGETKGAWGNGCQQRFDVEYAFHHSWDHGLTIIEYSRRGRFRVNPLTFFREGGRECFVHDGKVMAEKLEYSVKPTKEHVVAF